MTTLDLRLLRLDGRESDNLASLAKNGLWSNFHELSNAVAAKIANSYSSIILYHGTRLPNADLVRNHGLKLMTAHDLAELVSPLWRRPVQQIRETLEKGPHFSNKVPPRSLCLEPDRQVLFDTATNSFVREGSEALRGIATHEERNLLFSWKPYVVIANLPTHTTGSDYIVRVLKEHLPTLFSSGVNFPTTYCYNSYEDISSCHIFDVIEYEEFAENFPISTTLNGR